MKTLEKDISKYLKERGWDKLRPGDLAKSIAIESGELLELFQWYNPSLAEVKKDKEKIAEIKKELADVIIFCLDLSVTMGFDTRKIVLEKLEKAKEKYPAKLMKSESKKAYPGSKNYWKIKKEHRKKGL